MLLQWWVLTTLDKDIRKEISDTAFQVSRDTASAMVLHQIEVRRQKNSKIFKKTYWEWQKTHPSNAATDIYIELVKNSKNSNH